LTAFLATEPGVCPTCAYQTGGVAGDECPECGTQLQRAALPCPLCSYNLRGLKGYRCPECGHKLLLRVNLAEPRQRAYVAGVVAISLGLGFCTLMLVWVGFMLVSRPGGLPTLREVFPLCCGTVVAGMLLWQWMRRRSRLMRARALRRWAWVCVAAAAAMVCPVWFMATVR